MGGSSGGVTQKLLSKGGCVTGRPHSFTKPVSLGHPWDTEHICRASTDGVGCDRSGTNNPDEKNLQEVSSCSLGPYSGPATTTGALETGLYAMTPGDRC